MPPLRQQLLLKFLLSITSGNVYMYLWYNIGACIICISTVPYMQVGSWSITPRNWHFISGIYQYLNLQCTSEWRESSVIKKVSRLGINKPLLRPQPGVGWITSPAVSSHTSTLLTNYIGCCASLNNIKKRIRKCSTYYEALLIWVKQSSDWGFHSTYMYS